MIDYLGFFRNLAQGLVTINSHGHSATQESILKQLNIGLSFQLSIFGNPETHNNPAYAEAFAISKNSDQIKESCELLRRETPGKNKEQLFFGMKHGPLKCYDCGEELSLVYAGPNNLDLVSFDNSGNEIRGCQPYQGGINSTVSFPSGRVVFCNYFDGLGEREGRPSGGSKSCDWSINSRSGERLLRERLTQKGFAYGQLGNACVNPYISPAGDHIIVLYRKAADILGYCAKRRADGEILDEQYLENERQAHQVTNGGYLHVGSISCGVWRWMAADEATLAEMRQVHPAGDTHTAQVLPGNWQLTHHEDNYHNGFELISELRLING